DIATLTGAIMVALGPKMGGVFGDEELMAELKRIGDENGDFVWPMPLIEEYDKTLKSDYADFSNISNQGTAGSITAALFLRRFVPENCKWLHVDMAGVMDRKESGYYGNSATEYGARLLEGFVVHAYKLKRLPYSKTERGSLFFKKGCWLTLWLRRHVATLSCFCSIVHSCMKMERLIECSQPLLEWSNKG